MMFLYHLTVGHYMLGDWDETLALIDEMLELAPESRWSELSAQWYPGPAIVAHRGAVPALVEGDFSEEELSDVQSRAGYEASRAGILLANGRVTEAVEAGESAWRLRDVLGPHSFTKEGLVVALEGSYSLGDLDRVERLLADVRGLPPGGTPPTLTAQSARYEAKLAASRGEHERVEASFAASEAAYQELAMPFPLAVVQLEHAEWLVATNRPADAELLRAEARSTFERLGAQPWLDRIDGVDAQRVEVPASA
jgi:hypothetical protein